MAQYKLGEVEASFAALIWDNEPLSSSRLVELCADKLDWKKSTTYTVLRRLCQKGIFQNEGGMVTSLIDREEFAARQSEEFVEQAFDGSLPKFLAAFASRKRLSGEEIEQLQRLIDEQRG
ncbi:MAG: BlaI/MecI/CopY family transcriptional regulator [Oscillospiraceae bacterium]|nr:BlaI/MecI/CopY family transcriptional regulator [Oscillospiraceae bacterium]MDE7171951.1 BlaI/MecI/CopY family transcriptional regulator [Oscillospiraceae bacterium]